MLCVYDVSSYDEYSFQLSVLHDLIGKYSDCHAVLGGDLNADFARSGGNTTLLLNVCSQDGLLPVVQHSCSNVDYTYNFAMKHFSVIDHVILSEQLFHQAVCCVRVVHDVDNV